MHLNLLWLTSTELFERLSPHFNTHSDVELVHFRPQQLSTALSRCMNSPTDLLLLERKFLNQKTEKILKILPQQSTLKALVIKPSENPIFAYKVNIRHCFENTISAHDITQLIRSAINQKIKAANFKNPFERKLILIHKKKGDFNIIPWEKLISYQKIKEETLIHLTEKISFLHPIPYNYIKSTRLPHQFFYEIRKGLTLNLNHLNQIDYIEPHYHHCKLSDGRIIEISSHDRSLLLKFLKIHV